VRNAASHFIELQIVGCEFRSHYRVVCQQGKAISHCAAWQTASPGRQRIHSNTKGESRIVIGQSIVRFRKPPRGYPNSFEIGSSLRARLNSLVKVTLLKQRAERKGFHAKPSG